MKGGVTVLVIFIGLVLIVGGYFFFNQDGSDSGVSINEENENNETKTLEVTEPNVHHIEIIGFEFTPSEIRVKVGDTVVWTNMDSSSHTVTSDYDEELDSGYLRKGETYAHIFIETGTFEYHCIPHPYMKGKVIVE